MLTMLHPTVLCLKHELALIISEIIEDKYIVQ